MALDPLCRKLATAQSGDLEKISFALNVKASDLDILSPRLRDLHFSRGRYAGWSVADLESALGDGIKDESLVDLAVGVNRAFANGHDAGVLSPWVSTLLCSSETSIDGPMATRCGFLDSECTRGVYREKGSCCSMQIAPTGSLCSAGVCDGAGTCRPEHEILGRALLQGPITWLEAPAGENPRAWHSATENTVRLSIATDEELLASSTKWPAINVPFELWQSRSGRELGRLVAEIAAPELGKERIRLGHINRADGARITATAIDVTGGAEKLYLAGKIDEICLIRHRKLDELGPVLSDCSLPGAIKVPCPGRSQGVSCEHQDGRTAVIGEGLIIAFEIILPVLDVPLHIFPGQTCVSSSCIRDPNGPVGQIDFDDLQVPRACDFGAGCFGQEICFEFRGARNCFCSERRERCDGADNDCDGEIDEDVDAECEDGIACTGNICAGDRGCIDLSPDQNSGACWQNYCAKGVCNGELPSWANPGSVRTSQDANGCSLSLDDNFCENVWDRCECNGNSVCDPGAAALENDFAAIAGCSELSPRATPMIAWPCEATGDSDLCTDEICCEPNPGCRAFLETTPPTPSPYGYRIVPGSSEQCTNDLVPRRAAGGPTNPNSSTICVRAASGSSVLDRQRIHCNDGNPCTFDQCVSPTTGQCTHTPLARGGRGTIQPFPLTVSIFGVERELDPGCRNTHEGCGFERCIYSPISTLSTCTLFASDAGTAGATTDECSGLRGSDSCLRAECDGMGECIDTPENARCNDGIACTVDICHAGFGICDSLTVAPGKCFIDDTCFTAGDLSGRCRVCNPSLDSYQWSAVPGCLD